MDFLRRQMYWEYLRVSLQISLVFPHDHFYWFFDPVSTCVYPVRVWLSTLLRLLMCAWSAVKSWWAHRVLVSMTCSLKQPKHFDIDLPYRNHTEEILFCSSAIQIKEGISSRKGLFHQKIDNSYSKRQYSRIPNLKKKNDAAMTVFSWQNRVSLWTPEFL